VTRNTPYTFPQSRIWAYPTPQKGRLRTKELDHVLYVKETYSTGHRPLQPSKEAAIRRNGTGGGGGARLLLHEGDWPPRKSEVLTSVNKLVIIVVSSDVGRTRWGSRDGRSQTPIVNCSNTRARTSGIAFSEERQVLQPSTQDAELCIIDGVGCPVGSS